MGLRCCTIPDVERVVWHFHFEIMQDPNLRTFLGNPAITYRNIPNEQLIQDAATQAPATKFLL